MARPAPLDPLLDDLFQVPLHIHPGDDIDGDLRLLEEDLRSAKPISPVEIYDQAALLSFQIESRLDKRRKDLARRLLDIEHELETALEEPRAARARADLVRARALETIAAEAKWFHDFSARRRAYLRRTREHALLEALRSGFESFQRDVEALGEAWMHDLERPLEDRLRFVAQSSTNPACDAKPSKEKLKNRATIAGKPPNKPPVDLPTGAELVVKFLVAHKEVAIYPVSLVSLFVFSSLASSELALKAVAQLGAAISFLPLVFLGVGVARRERRKLLRDAEDAHDAALRAWALAELDEALDNHASGLARYIDDRHAAWNEAVLSSLQRRFQPEIDAAETNSRDKRAALLLEQSHTLEEKRRMEILLDAARERTLALKKRRREAELVAPR